MNSLYPFLSLFQAGLNHRSWFSGSLLRTSLGVFATLCLFSTPWPNPALAQEAGVLVQPARSGSNDAIQVTLDPQVVPEATVNREPNRLTIELPKGASGGFFVSPALQSNPNIKITQQGNNTVLTIDSASVGLSVQQVSQTQSNQAVPLPPTPSKSTTSASKPATSSKNPSKTASKPAPKTTPAEKKPANPLANMMTGPDSGKPEVPTASQGAESASDTPKADPSDTQQTDGFAAAAVSEDGSPLPMDPPAPGPDGFIEGEDGVPLDQVLKEDHLSGVAEDGLFVRILISLMAVLGLIWLVLKFGLPYWFKIFPPPAQVRDGHGPIKFGMKPSTAPQQQEGSTVPHPAPSISPLTQRILDHCDKGTIAMRGLLDRLKVKAQTWMDNQNAMDDTPIGPKGFHTNSDDEPPVPQRPNRRRQPGTNTTAAAAQKPQPAYAVSAPQQYATAPTGLDSALDRAPAPKFEVVTSMPLNKDQSLHLIRIKQFELIIATTPTSVNLIKDISGQMPQPMGMDDLSSHLAALGQHLNQEFFDSADDFDDEEPGEITGRAHPQLTYSKRVANPADDFTVDDLAEASLGRQQTSTLEARIQPQRPQNPTPSNPTAVTEDMQTQAASNTTPTVPEQSAQPKTTATSPIQQAKPAQQPQSVQPDSQATHAAPANRPSNKATNPSTDLHALVQKYIRPEEIHPTAASPHNGNGSNGSNGTYTSTPPSRSGKVYRPQQEGGVPQQPSSTDATPNNANPPREQVVYLDDYDDEYRG